jgi:hypothetical protein
MLLTRKNMHLTRNNFESTFFTYFNLIHSINFGPKPFLYEQPMELGEGSGPSYLVKLPSIVDNYFVTYLRLISINRSRMISRLFPARILIILENTLLFHLSILLSTVSIIVSGMKYLLFILLIIMIYLCRFIYL